MRGKGFEFIQRARLFEYFGIQLDGGRRAEHTRATAGVFFGRLGMRGGVRTQKEFVRFLTGYGGHQCLPVAFAFQYRQTIMMRAHAADQQIIAVEQQVLRGNGSGHVVACIQDKARGFGSSDVFEHDFQIRHLRQNGFHHALDESGFAVEDIDVGIGYFAVDQKAHVLYGDFVQHGQQFE